MFHRFIATFVAAFFVLATTDSLAQNVKVVKDVVYHVVKREKQGVDRNGKPLEAEIKLRFDAYLPETSNGKRPGIILLHGGGWQFGDKADKSMVEQATLLASNGYVVFSVSYRFAPEFRYPAQLDDVQRAVRWIRANANDYNLDTERLGAMGESAGGHLASLLGVRDTRDNSDETLAKFSSRVSCVVDLFGPADFTAPTETLKFGPVSAGLVLTLFGKSRDAAPDLYKDGSPVTHIDKKAASFLIMHGELDPLVPVDQSKRLEAALKTAGVEVTFHLMEKDYHGFRVAANKEKQKNLTLEFFKKQLKP